MCLVNEIFETLFLSEWKFLTEYFAIPKTTH
jgi:hypothetical protein